MIYTTKKVNCNFDWHFQKRNLHWKSGMSSVIFSLPLSLQSNRLQSNNCCSALSVSYIVLLCHCTENILISMIVKFSSTWNILHGLCSAASCSFSFYACLPHLMHLHNMNNQIWGNSQFIITFSFTYTAVDDGNFRFKWNKISSKINKHTLYLSY